MCLNCNDDGYNKKFIIKERGYSSIFDLEMIEIPLCKKCIKKLNVNEEWFNELADKNGEYQHENEIWNLLIKIGGESLTNICSSSIISLQ